jgi:murein L,D-transpeptidase YcbB/YkuD
MLSNGAQSATCIDAATLRAGATVLPSKSLSIGLAAVFALLGDSAAAQSQGTRSRIVRAIGLDAMPSPESGARDPFAPVEVERPAPLAPGAPTPSTEAVASANADPIVALVRQRLAASRLPRSAEDREDLAAALAYYGAGTDQPLWTGKDGLTAKARQAIEEIGKADDWGLKASAFDLPTLPDPSPPNETLAEAEIKIALAVLKYARHARGGRLDPASVSRKFDQKPVIYDPKSVLQAIAGAEAADTYLQGLHPKHLQFDRLRRALVAARGAKPGVVSAAKPSIQQLIVNMERWRWMPPDLGPFYVWDSIPDQMTRVVADGKVLLSEKIVVGKVETPTPIFSAGMQFIIFHPSWGVPPGMKANELWPQLRNTGGGWFSSKPLASAVLEAHGLQATRGGVPIDPDAVDWASVDIRNYEFTQGPGPTNVLGIVKFRFPNRHDVYMHDTPERHLFAGAVRAFSHGCMRVQNAVRLAEVLLAHDKGWSPDKVRDYVRRGGEIALTQPIPVHVTYFTVTVDDAGAVAVRPDIYGLDSRIAFALEAREADIAATRPASGGEPAARSAVVSRAKPREQRKPAEAPLPFNPFSSLAGN